MSFSQGSLPFVIVVVSSLFLYVPPVVSNELVPVARDNVHESTDCESAYLLSLLNLEERRKVYKLCSSIHGDEGIVAQEATERTKQTFQDYLTRLVSLKDNSDARWQFWVLVDLMPAAVKEKFLRKEMSPFLELIRNSKSLNKRMKRLTTQLSQKKQYGYVADTPGSSPTYFGFHMKGKEKYDKKIDTSDASFKEFLALLKEPEEKIAPLVSSFLVQIRYEEFLSQVPTKKRGRGKNVQTENSEISGDALALALDSFFKLNNFIVLYAEPSANREPELFSGFPVESIPVVKVEGVETNNVAVYYSLQQKRKPFIFRTFTESKIPIIERQNDATDTDTRGMFYQDLACMNFNLAVDSVDTKVFVDGIPLEGVPLKHKNKVFQKVSHTVPLPPGYHTVSVMKKVKKAKLDKQIGDWAILIEDKIHSKLSYRESQEGIACRPYAADLRQSDVITLAPIKVESSCMESQFSPGKLWGAAAEFLRKHGGKYEFRDMRAVADTVVSLSELQNLLTFSDAAPLGASRKKADTMRLAKTAAEELWRQGISQVISLELQCSGNAGEIQPSLLARKVDVTLIYESVKDPVLGADLKGIVSLETESISSVSKLEGSTKRVMSRLLGRPYLRFSDDGRVFDFKDKINIYIEQFCPHGSERQNLEVSAFQVPQYSDASICEALEQRGTFAGQAPSTGNLGDPLKVEQPESTYVPAKEGDDAANESSSTRGYIVTISPKRSGQVIVRARTKGTENYVYKCIAGEERNRLFWGKLALSKWEYDKEYDVINDEVKRLNTRIYTKFVVGVAGRSDTNLGNRKLNIVYGPYLGTMIILNHLSAPPTWNYLEDPDAIAESSLDYQNGRLSLEWQRRSLDVGFMFSFEMPICTLFNSECGYLARRAFVGVFGELGIGGVITTLDMNTRRLARTMGETLKRFVGDVDVNFAIGANVGYYFSKNLNLSLGGEFNFVAIDDMVQHKGYAMEEIVKNDWAVNGMLFARVRYGR